jgi:hypothetical protein
MTQKPVLRAGVYARALRASQNVKIAEVFRQANVPVAGERGKKVDMRLYCA